MKHHHLCYGPLLVALVLPVQHSLLQRSNFAVGAVPSIKRMAMDDRQVSLAAAFSKEKTNSRLGFPDEDCLSNLGCFTII